MANTFNISVAPEIAALEAKINIVDTVVDLIRGTDVVNLSSAIANNSTAIGLIRTEDVVALDSKLTIIDTVADNIRNIDVPNIQANIDSNETKIDTLDTVADAIKLKTDLIPQNVRGEFIHRIHGHSSTDYTDSINITGHGKLLYISIHSINTVDMDLLITIDGTAFNVLSAVGDDSYHPVILDQSLAGLNLQYITAADARNTLLNIEFDTTLLIQTKRTGDAGTVTVQIIYQLDDF